MMDNYCHKDWVTPFSHLDQEKGEIFWDPGDKVRQASPHSQVNPRVWELESALLLICGGPMLHKE
jgi:hypothetical protein